MEAEELDRLLSLLDPDRTKAAERYVEIRSRLIRLFQWRGSMAPEDLADETLDRVARRLQGGAQTQAPDPLPYFVGVANLVYKEHLRREVQQHSLMSGLSSLLHSQAREPEEDLRLQAMQSALNELPPEQRDLLLRYHSEDDRAESRREIARSLGITLNTLRIRAHRVRRELERRISMHLSSSTADLPGPEYVASDLDIPDLKTDAPVGEPDVLVIWDPDILTAEEYSELIGALGDLVRACGGLGLTRAQPEGYSVPASVVVRA